MNLSLEALARRREALVERSATQRDDIACTIESMHSAATGPVLLGTGGLVSLIAASPNLRSWLVRAWAFYALGRRLFAK